MSKPRLLIVVNVDWFFLSHRLPIAMAALRDGYEVHVATTLTDRHGALVSAGLVVHPVQIVRNGTGLLREARTLLALRRIIATVRPAVLHLVTIKPVLFGGIVARLLCPVPVVAAVPGMGSAFTGDGWRARLLRRLLIAAYRVAFGNPRLMAILQNADDRSLLLGATMLPPERCVMVSGSGVDLQTFATTPLPAGTPIVVLIARLLRDKGVHEFVEAAQHLRTAGVHARFCLVGAPDPDNRSTITASDLQVWQRQQDVELWGFRSDVAEVLRQAYLVVLPSYREGMPKVLLEAAASGRAVVTTDVPGCRDAIEPGVTGLLVPPRDVPALANAMSRLLQNRALCQQYGEAGRRLAESRFSLNAVVDTHLAVYRQVQRL
ncbi:glycosyltransferase family 4 protein [Pseudorhodoferax sp.]|uniref:glycosyltransferase family 4 protein n=1 Tax=Pseudorhodoferax sp. TaxID=1993553 RepID=UPI002DD66E58|nr:glycosyltransferase family 4 protein [Pseudorhodoferax sp.]